MSKEAENLTPMQDLKRFCRKRKEDELSKDPLNRQYQIGFDNGRDHIRSLIDQSYLKREKAFAEYYHAEKSEQEVKRVYDWLMDENREPAQTKFTAGETRNLAKEIEFRIHQAKKS
jgi:hypothetical protein